MAGHSKWKNIKHKKAAADAKRSKVFTKLSKEITVAAKAGGGDKETNPTLRTLLEKARHVNMPQENIMRAIKKGTGELPGMTYEAYRYEGYGPGGFAVMVEVLTDNKNRAVADVRHIFSKHSGSLAETGAVSWMFKHAGMILVSGEEVDPEEIMELTIEYTIFDISYDEEDGVCRILCEPQHTEEVKRVLADAGYSIDDVELTWIATTEFPLDEGASESVESFVDALEELEDVQNVYTNVV